MICKKCKKEFTRHVYRFGHSGRKHCYQCVPYDGEDQDFISKEKKQCPICGKLFNKATTTCSHSCANTFFRSGKNHPNYKELPDSKARRYRSICFQHHDKKCIICQESNIVDVHHYDENPNNNDYKNLIPLCPTHHKYMHSKHKALIYNTIYEYYKKQFEQETISEVRAFPS